MCLPPLGEKGSEHDGTRDTQSLITEVSFGHGRLESDRLAPGFIAADGEFLHRPIGRDSVRNSDNTCKHLKSAARHQLNNDAPVMSVSYSSSSQEFSLAFSAPCVRLLLLIFRLVNALMAKYIRGRTGDILDVLALTCTWEWQKREL